MHIYILYLYIIYVCVNCIKQIRQNRPRMAATWPWRSARPAVTSAGSPELGPAPIIGHWIGWKSRRKPWGL